jgi:hypothetical protein
LNPSFSFLIIAGNFLGFNTFFLETSKQTYTR